MAENMYRGLWSWIICVVVTVVVSMFTNPKLDSEFVGLVYGETEIPTEGEVPLFISDPCSGPGLSRSCSLC